MTRPRKNPVASRIRTRDLPLSRRTPYHEANEAVVVVAAGSTISVITIIVTVIVAFFFFLLLLLLKVSFSFSIPNMYACQNQQYKCLFNPLWTGYPRSFYSMTCSVWRNHSEPITCRYLLLFLINDSATVMSDRTMGRV